MSAFLELAERCEKAMAPDRELDDAIWRLINPIHAGIVDSKYDGQVPEGWHLPLTASLDAAMTLVPEGYRLTGLAETIVNCPQPWRAILWEKRRNTKKRPHGDGATAALALCAAALRAIASVDTLPKGQDAKQGLAGTEGSAVPKADAQ